MRYDPDGEVLVTCGAIEAITATLLATVGPATSRPDLADVRVLLAGGPPHRCDARYVHSTRMQLRPRPRRHRAHADAPDAGHPAVQSEQPDRTVFSAAQVQRLLEIAAANDLLVITDEVYKDFVYTDVEPASPARFPAHRDRVVSVWSFSKAYAMTGWRVGFLAAPARHVTAS